MVQMHCIDMNAGTRGSTSPTGRTRLLRPRPAGVADGFALAVRVAHLIRAALEELDLRSYVKTSGADGIHVLVPIARALVPETYEFAELLSRRLEAEHPGVITTEWLKKKRAACSSTTARTGTGRRSRRSTRCARSRARRCRRRSLGGADREVRPRDFSMREALSAVEQHGDLFEPALRGGQSLGLRRCRKLRG